MVKQIPIESERYTQEMRGTCLDLKEVRLYTDRMRFEAEKLISFDSEFEGVSSLSYFMGSLLSSVIVTAIKYFHSQQIVLDEIEGVIAVDISQPLALVPVRGYHDPSEIEAIRIKLFYYAEGDDYEIVDMFHQSQRLNPLYSLINRATPIELILQPVL